MKAYATKDLLQRIIDSGADPIQAKGIMIRVIEIKQKVCTLGFDVIDENGKAMVSLQHDHIFSAGETLRIMDLDAVFKVCVSAG